MNIRALLLACLMAITAGMGCNPFAPTLDPDRLANVNLLGDPSSVEGYFQLFKNAYELRDTTLYGRLFSEDFLFSYYDPDLGQDIEWDRATELAISYNLFQSVIQINLDWNYYIELDTTDIEALIVRNFSLSIEEDEQTVFSGSGRAKFKLRRETPIEAWQAYSWFDDSDF